MTQDICLFARVQIRPSIVSDANLWDTLFLFQCAWFSDLLNTKTQNALHSYCYLDQTGLVCSNRILFDINFLPPIRGWITLLNQNRSKQRETKTDSQRRTSSGHVFHNVWKHLRITKGFFSPEFSVIRSSSQGNKVDYSLCWSLLMCCRL